MRRLWLLFAQSVTVLVAVWFVLITLKPQWLQQPSLWGPEVQVFQAPATASTVASAGSLSVAAKRASPSVVSINTASRKSSQADRMRDPWFRYFFGDQDEDPSNVGLGSGVIVSADGYILTNNHVVETADEITVVLNDGRRTQARLVGTDPDTDLAVLKIKLDRLPVMVMSVSALGRSQLGINTFENFIQTDAAINPGNSGGALVDVQGNLLGINTAIYSRSGGSLGIGFAIPVSTARQVLEGIVKDGQVVRGWIGVEPTELTPELAKTFNVQRADGVIITGVLQSGPAARAGVVPGDVLLAVEGQAVQTVAELLAKVSALKPGRPARLKFLRNNQEIEFAVTPAQRPRAKSAPR